MTAPVRPVNHQELLLQQDALGGNGPHPSTAEELGDRRQEMPKQDEKVSHGDEG